MNSLIFISITIFILKRLTSQTSVKSHSDSLDWIKNIRPYIIVLLDLLGVAEVFSSITSFLQNCFSFF